MERRERVTLRAFEGDDQSRVFAGCLATVSESLDFMKRFPRESGEAFRESVPYLHDIWIRHFHDRNTGIEYAPGKLLSLSDATWLAWAHTVVVTKPELRYDWSFDEIKEMHAKVRMYNREFGFYGDKQQQEIESLEETCASAVVHAKDPSEELRIDDAIDREQLEDWEYEELTGLLESTTIEGAMAHLKEERKRSKLMYEVEQGSSNVSLAREATGHSLIDAFQKEEEEEQQRLDDLRIERAKRRKEAHEQEKIRRRARGEDSDSDFDPDGDDDEDEIETEQKARELNFLDCTKEAYQHKPKFYRVLAYHRLQFLSDCSRLFFNYHAVQRFIHAHEILPPLASVDALQRAEVNALMITQSRVETTKAIHEATKAVFYRLYMPVGAADAYHRIYPVARTAVHAQTIVHHDCGALYASGTTGMAMQTYEKSKEKPNDGTNCIREAHEWIMWGRYLNLTAGDLEFTKDFLYSTVDISLNATELLQEIDKKTKRRRRPVIIKLFTRYHVQAYIDSRMKLIQCEDTQHAIATWCMVMAKHFNSELVTGSRLHKALDRIVKAADRTAEMRRNMAEDDLFF